MTKAELTDLKDKVCEVFDDALEALDKGGDEEKPSRRRRKKAEEPEERPAGRRRKRKAPAGKSEDGPTEADVREKLTEVIEEFGTEEAQSILKEFGGGAKKVSELDESRYKAVIDECQAALDEPEDD